MHCQVSAMVASPLEEKNSCGSPGPAPNQQACSAQQHQKKRAVYGKACQEKRSLLSCQRQFDSLAVRPFVASHRHRSALPSVTFLEVTLIRGSSGCLAELRDVHPSILLSTALNPSTAQAPEHGNMRYTPRGISRPLRFPHPICIPLRDQRRFKSPLISEPSRLVTVLQSVLGPEFYVRLWLPFFFLSITSR